MASTIEPITAVTGESQGLAGLGQRIAESLRDQEARIQESFVKGLDPASELMRPPAFLRAQFEEWDRAYTMPEDRRMVEELKGKVLEMYGIEARIISDKVRDQSERLKLELAFKAVAKTTQGIQSLLSSQ